MIIKTRFQISILLGIIIVPYTCLGSQLDCRSRSAYVVAKIKAEYLEPIPNETIEFAKSAAMEMCLTNNAKLRVAEKPRKSEKTGSPQSPKKPFLGIKFGNSERKDGNDRLLNRR